MRSNGPISIRFVQIGDLNIQVMLWSFKLTITHQALVEMMTFLSAIKSKEHFPTIYTHYVYARHP
jgi:hypothetical protein